MQNSLQTMMIGLNPYSNGRYSTRARTDLVGESDEFTS